MPALLALIPGRVWVGGALAAALIAGGWYALHQYGDGRFNAGRDEVMAAWGRETIQRQAVATQAGIDAARETQRRLDKQQESQRAQSEQLAAARDDAAGARAAADRLRDFAASLAATARGGAASRDPAAVPDGPAADAALSLLTDLLSRSEDTSGELAEFADSARIAGQQCERDYDALTTNP